MSEAKKYPTPVTNPETKPFWDAAAQGKFLIKRCTTCGDRDVFLVNLWAPRKLDMIEYGRGHRVSLKDVPPSLAAMHDLLRGRLGAPSSV